MLGSETAILASFFIYLSSSYIYVTVVQVAAGRWGDGPMPGTVAEMIEYTKSMEVAVPLPQWYYEFLEMLKDEAEEFIPCSKVRVGKHPCHMTPSTKQLICPLFSSVIMCTVSKGNQPS